MNNQFTRTGILFVLSAPSGAGKTTLREGLRKNADFVFSVSCTTRPPRPGERDGVDYHFIGLSEFDDMASSGEFLEHAEVHTHRYGTPLRAVRDQLDAGTDVLLDIDTAGAAQIRACADPAIRAALADIFIMPPAIDELRRRLEKRGTESPGQIEIRIRNARREMAFWRDYRYTIASGTIEEDLANFRAIMCAERLRTRRMNPLPDSNYATPQP